MKRCCAMMLESHRIQLPGWKIIASFPEHPHFLSERSMAALFMELEWSFKRESLTGWHRLVQEMCAVGKRGQ